MAKQPDEDPRITDLRAYRKAREAEKRRKPPNPKAQMRESFLGANPRAGLILALVALALAAFVFLPLLMRGIPR